MLRTSIATIVLGFFYFCPLDCDASVMVVDFAAVETGCMVEKYILLRVATKYVFFSFFRSRCFCCCCCVLLLLPTTTSVLKRREVPATVSTFSVSDIATGVSFASIVFLLLSLRRDACRKKQTKRNNFLFLVAALLLLFTQREGCAEKKMASAFCVIRVRNQSRSV